MTASSFPAGEEGAFCLRIEKLGNEPGLWQSQVHSNNVRFISEPEKADKMRQRETEHNSSSGQGGFAHLVSLIVCVLAISSAGMIVSQSGSSNTSDLRFSSMGGADDQPVRVHPRDKPNRSDKESTQLPKIIPGPKRSDRDTEGKVGKVKRGFSELPSLVSEIRKRKTMRFWLSRTTTAYVENPNVFYQYVNPSNLENHEIHYVSRSSTIGILDEIEFQAPWQFRIKVQQDPLSSSYLRNYQEGFRYPLSHRPFTGVYRTDEINDLCAEMSPYNMHLKVQSLLRVYSGRDNLFHNDSMLRLKKDVPAFLLEKMDSSEIDDQLIENPPFNHKDRLCEIVTILWLTGLLDKIEESANPSSSGEDQIEILVTHSPPRIVAAVPTLIVGVSGGAVSSQCFFTAIRSTFEPDVIHVCLIDYEVLALGYRYEIQKTWSIGTLH